MSGIKEVALGVTSMLIMPEGPNPMPLQLQGQSLPDAAQIVLKIIEECRDVGIALERSNSIRSCTTFYVRWNRPRHVWLAMHHCHAGSDSIEVPVEPGTQQRRKSAVSKTSVDVTWLRPASKFCFTRVSIQCIIRATFSIQG